MNTHITTKPDIPFPSFRLGNRLAVITGASEGIGCTLAIAFAKVGARIVLASRRLHKLEEVRSAILDAGGEAEALKVDVTRLEDIAELSALAADWSRRDDLDLILVNNAGFGFTKPALEVSEEDWDRLIDTHMKGTFFCCQQLGAAMIERGYGKIINLSSAWAASSDAGKNAYCAAKAGISHLTAALSTEWAPKGVRVNALAPTATMTDFTAGVMERSPERAERLRQRIKLGRFAHPEDLIGPAIFLASDASDFVTGHTLFVDGGFTTGM